MNLLILSNSHLDCNSGIHILSVAKELVKLGLSCQIAVPDAGDVVKSGKHEGLRIADAATICQRYDVDAPDLVWVWTPREANRKCFERLQAIRRVPYVIHFEDNEAQITKSAFGLSSHDFKRWAAGGEGPGEVPPHLSNPVRVRELVRGAVGITGLVEELIQLAQPASARTQVFWPGYDESLPWGMEPDAMFRRTLGVAPGRFILAYTGNLHPANVGEVRSLYLAVALLNRRGVPVTLLRTGKDYAPLTDHGEELLREHVVDLGLVPRADLPRILSVSDALVQPGLVDDFNIYRFPSKVPEFLASARPVMLPRCNIGQYLTDGVDAIVLPRCDAHAITVAMENLLPDVERRRRIGKAGAAFAAQHLRWGVAAKRLFPFFTGLVA